MSEIPESRDLPPVTMDDGCICILCGWRGTFGEMKETSKEAKDFYGLEPMLGCPECRTPTVHMIDT